MIADPAIAMLWGITRESLDTWLQAGDDPLVDLRVERPTLEERFLEITSIGKGEAA